MASIVWLLKSSQLSDVMMDESCSNTYLESLRRKMGGFSMTEAGLFMRPLPFSCLRGVTVFLDSAFSPTTSSGTVLGFF